MELDELKKSWNALDEHLKDKKLLNEENIHKLINHTGKSIHSLARMNVKLISLSIPLLIILFVIICTENLFNTPFVIIALVAIPALIWDLFTTRFLQATKVDEMPLVDVIKRINQVNRWTIRERIIGTCFILCYIITSYIYWKIWEHGIYANIFFFIVWSAVIAFILWIYQSKYLKRIKEIKKNLDELKELTI